MNDYQYVHFKTSRASKGVVVKLGDEFNEKYKEALKKDQSSLYRSISIYSEDILEHWKRVEDNERQIKIQKGEDVKGVKGSVGGYIGKVTTDYIYVDIDCKKAGLNVSLEHARNFAKRINEHGVKFSAIRTYFSGAHGFHFCVPAGFIGITPSNVLHEQMRMFVDRICGGTEGVMYDHKIYIRQLAFRLPWSFHEGSGLYKIPIATEDLLNRSTTPEKILEWAKTRMPVPKYDTDVRIIKSLNELWPKDEAPEQKKFITQMEVPQEEAHRINLPIVNTQQKICMQLLMNEDIKDGGGRHSATIVLASYLANRGDPPEIVRAVMKSWRDKQTEPTEEKKFWADVEDCIKKRYLHKCDHEVLAARCDKRCFLYYKNVKGADKYEQEGVFKTLLDLKKVYQEIQDNGRRVTFGIEEVDKLLGGWAPGEVALLLGRPGTGKTTFMLFLALQMHKKTGMPILILEQELHGFLIFKKMLAATMEISNDIILRIYNESKQSGDGKFDEIVEAAHREVSGIHFCTIDRLTTEDKIGFIEAFKRKYGMPAAVFEDYLGRGKAPGIDNRHKMGDLASSLKEIAKACDVPYMSLVQVRRGPGEDHTTPLTMFDGKDTSELEQVGDYMFGLYRKYYNEMTVDDIVTFQILKAREGGENIELDFKWTRDIGHYHYDPELNKKTI
jgi:energy-coupling factor transporter ATP-binding protein EcfA2